MNPTNLEDFLAPAANIRIPVTARTIVVAVIEFLAKRPAIPAILDIAK